MPLLFFLSLILSISLANSNFVDRSTNETDIYKGYRLPETQIPSRYDIDLTLGQEIFEGTATSFNGSVNITFTVTEEINILEFHSCVTINNLVLQSNEWGSITVNRTSNETLEITTLSFETHLNLSTTYFLFINYTGQLDTINMQGLYRSSYKSQTGETRYLVTTQLQATNARRVFPCFDEPHFKAKFGLRITHPKSLNATSNTLQNSTETVSDDYETVTFTDTPAMSTYLLAVTVADFTCTDAENITANIPHRVCSRPGTESERTLAADIGTKLLRALGEYLNISYSEMMIGKMDQLAIPDFSAGAMENWGMVTFKELALLYNPNDTSNLYKQKVITIIAHEFTHMWFGDWVTLDWWDYTFLNEGFARYLQYFIQTKVQELEEYEMDKQFVVEVQQSVLVTDAVLTSDSLTSIAATPSEIQGKFGKISYDKGASVIRMVESLMPGTFDQSLYAYLRQKNFSTAVPNDLWSVLSTFVSAQNLPVNTTFTEVMENWTNKAGFPLVTVTASGTDIILTQKRFLYEGSDETQWYIPINYTIFNEDDSVNITVRTWLIPGEQTTISDVLSDNRWVIVNPKGIGFYRVHYDTTVWNRIETVLKNNIRAIDNVTRSQIIDDILNLARAKEISYSVAFQKLDFLRNETCYYPWHSAIEGFNYLISRLGETSILGIRVRAMLLELMETVKSKNITLDSENVDNHMHSLKVQKILTETCKLGDDYCVSKSIELFQKYKNGESIDKNIRSIVYCNALRHSTDIISDWNFLWNKLQTTSQANEIYNMMTSLACTENESLLQYYLEQSVNASSGIRIQNVADIWASVYTSSTKGVDVAFDYFSKDYERIQGYFSKSTNLLPGIANRFSTLAQIEKLKQLMEHPSLSSSMKSDCGKALSSARENMGWVYSIESDLNVHFEIVSSAVPSCGIMVHLIISAIFTIKIIL